MKVLVTAGSTITMIDKVRGITNIFRGRTGTEIARYFTLKGAEVTLLTSSPHLARVFQERARVIRFKTYEELLVNMEKLIKDENFDVIIHSAAVSDYACIGMYQSDDKGQIWMMSKKDKISSGQHGLFIGLTPTLKIIDQIRQPWGFRGILVKFKLESGISDEQLIQIAARSAKHSGADLIVANCREWFEKRAFIIGPSDSLEKDIGFSMEVSRHELPSAIHRMVTK